MIEKNKIICGDAYKLIKEIPDKSIDLIITDPPYDMSGGKKIKATVYSKNNFNSGINDAIEMGICNGIDYSILDEFCRVLKKIYIYIWCNVKQISTYMSYFEKKGCNVNLLVWHKTNVAPLVNNTFIPELEYIVVAREEGCKLTGSFDDKHKYYESDTNQRDKRLFGHPTCKPTWILKRFILNSSKGGDVILDPFMGSGSTAVACKELGRNFIGFELSEKYTNIANARLKGYNNLDKKGEYLQEKLF